MAKQHIELIARGLHIASNAVLLCRDVRRGYLYLPGGHVEFGEPAAVALAREIEEELGVQCRVGELIAAHEESFVQSGAVRHEINVMFHVEHLAGIEPLGPVPSAEDHIAFEWLDLAGAASADIRPASIRAFLSAGGTARGRAAWWSVMRPDSGD